MLPRTLPALATLMPLTRSKFSKSVDTLTNAIHISPPKMHPLNVKTRGFSFKSTYPEQNTTLPISSDHFVNNLLIVKFSDQYSTTSKCKYDAKKGVKLVLLPSLQFALPPRPSSPPYSAAPSNCLISTHPWRSIDCCDEQFPR